MLRSLAALYDRLDTERTRTRLETATVWLAGGGFLLHLASIAVNRNAATFGLEGVAGLDRNFLHAVYTPFSFILFYEVLLLVLAIPRSHTTSVGKQYEIISLITVRRVFKDIGAFEEPGEWSGDGALAREILTSEEARMVLYDMVGAFLMFLLVTAFATARRAVRTEPPDHDITGYINIKKSLSLLLAVLFTGLAGWNLAEWTLASLPGGGGPEASVSELDRFFFPQFFECMIFVDLFLFIVSIRYYEKYEYVFRNAAFVISTVLLRLSLSTPKPFDLGLALTGMLYGLAVLGVFAFFTSVTRRADPARDARSAPADE